MTNAEVKALNEFLSLPECLKWMVLSNAAAYKAGEAKAKQRASA